MDDGSVAVGSGQMDELLDAVTGGLTSVRDVEQQGFDSLGQQLSDISDSLAKLENDEEQGTDGVTTVVALDDAQMQQIHDGISLLVTETFVCFILVAMLCGLSVWQIMTRGWRS